MNDFIPLTLPGTARKTTRQQRTACRLNKHNECIHTDGRCFGNGMIHMIQRIYWTMDNGGKNLIS